MTTSTTRGDPRLKSVVPLDTRLVQTQWDDLRVSVTDFQFGGNADPTQVQDFIQPPAGLPANRDRDMYAFSGDDYVQFGRQMPHRYKEGTDLKLHFHWTPGDNGVANSGNTVTWGCGLVWFNVNGTIPLQMTGYTVQATCDGVDRKAQIVGSITIPGAGMNVSSQLEGIIYRPSGVGDTWSGTGQNGPILIEMDFHYEVESDGSDQEFSKT